MKKNRNMVSILRLDTKEILLKMKLLTLLMFTVFVSTAAVSYSQVTKFSMDLRDVTIGDVFQKIEEQSDFVILYNEKTFDINRKVNVNVKDKTVDNILDQIFNGDKSAYMIFDHQIAIYPNEIKDLPAEIKSEIKTQQTQNRTISGTVKDEKGQPMPGVSVVVKGTTTGTVTDADGMFTLSVPSDTKALQFSFIGMKTQEVDISGKTNVNVILEELTVSLGEVVAIGYGSVRKADLTGAVTSVNAKDFDKVPASSPLQALAGRTAGVQITANGGMPGAGSNVLVRGIKSINGTNAPIYVVDGVITTSIDNLDPNSIEVVSVLKDASAAAIYGARAANGVILVTTKRGSGRQGVDITFDSYCGIQTDSNLKLKLLNSSQYLELITEAYTNYGMNVPWNNQILEHYKGVNTNWQDLIQQTGVIQNYNLSLTGGSEKSNYYISAGYQDQKGRVIETGFKKYTLTFNTDHKINNWIKFGNSLNLYSLKRDGTQKRGGAISEPYEIAMRRTPITRAYEDNGDYGITVNTDLEDMNANPIWVAKNVINQSTMKGVQGSLYLTIEPLKGLEFTARGSMDYSIYHESYFYPGMPSPVYGWEWPTINFVEKYYNETNHWISDFLMNYTKIVGGHNFKFLLGYSLEESVNETLDATRSGTPNNQIHYLNAGDPATMTNTNGYTDWAFASEFGRFNYNYKNKYLFQATVRRDGTSRLQPSSRYGIFPSASVGWRISEEKFLKKVNLINDLKLRGSYGTLGNILSVGPYGTVASLAPLFAILNEAPVPAYTLNAAVNNDLKWESSLKKDIGLDATVWNNQFYTSVDYFVEDISNLLFTNPIPLSTGLITLPLINAGKMRNKGYEFEVGYRASIPDWTFDISFNLSHVKNEVTDLAGRDLRTSGLQEGYPAFSYFGYKSDGLIRNASQLDIYKTGSFTQKQIGDIHLLDIDGYDTNGALTGKPDGKVDAADRTLIGQKYPNLTYGGLATIGYKNWSLQVQLQGVQGIDQAMPVGGWESVMDLFSGFPRNEDARILNRYEATKNPNGTYPRLSISDSGQNLAFSEFWLEDASYLRIKNINLNYNLPKSACDKIKMKALGIFVSVENAYTFTGYSGPEVDTTSDPLIGVSQPRIWTLGLKATF